MPITLHDSRLLCRAAALSKLLNSAWPTARKGGQATFAVSNSTPPDRYDIEQWINIEAIQLLVHHASAVIAAIVIFAFVARLAIWLLPHGFVRKVVVIIDDVVLIGLLLYFGYEMLVYLWNRRPPVQRNAATRSRFRHRRVLSAGLLAGADRETAWRGLAGARAAYSPSRGNRRLAGISLS